jgi:hypothetical protein
MTEVICSDLEVETYLHTMHMELGQTEQFCSKWKGDPFGVAGVDYSNTYSVTSGPLCRLSDAQAIIDGLRGEVEEWTLRSQYNADTAQDVASERDQQAQRIGELEGLLRAACEAGRQLSNAAYNLAQREGHELTKCECALLSSLRKQWDAARHSALATVCAAAPNITPTSEHSGS